ncbi:MAG: hypothetical protein PVG93_03585 [Phycisphaerales bacterium]|jgi:chromosome segregation ATPase
MGLKDLLTKTGRRIRSVKLAKFLNHTPVVDNEGFLQTEDEDTAKQTEQGGPQQAKPESQQNEPEVDTAVLAKSVPAVPAPSRNESLERIQEGFNKLIDQLENINGNLNRQLTQHQQLMDRLDKLPPLLEGFGPGLENQQQLTNQLIEQLREAAGKNRQFIEAVERIPTETAKQTDALANIDHQLAAAADSDAQMAQSFEKFHQSLDRLDQSTTGQTDSIMQMSRTFAASDRYLKYIISRDKKRMFWLFVVSIGVCVFVVLTLAGIIIYLSR